MKNTRYINNVSKILDINMLLNKNYEYNLKKLLSNMLKY